MLTAITNFLLTQWIWSITAGFTHIVINFLLLFILLKLWDHLSWLWALFLSILLSIGPFIIFFAIVGGILVWGLKVPYVLPEDANVGSYNVLNTSLLLAGIYIIFQIMILWIVNKWKPLNLWRTFLCIVCANLMTALLIYKLTFNDIS